MTEEDQSGYSPYPQYYYQQYGPPQFYYNPQEYYQGNPNYYYYQGGGGSYGPDQAAYHQEYYNQGMYPQNLTPNMDYSGERQQNDRGRGQPKGQQGQRSRGGGHESTGDNMPESKLTESKENIPQNSKETSSKKYSESRNRGRGRGNYHQNYQGREFSNRNNSEARKQGQATSSAYSRNETNTRNIERKTRNEKHDYDGNYDKGQAYSNRGRNYQGNHSNQEYSRHQNNSDRGQYGKDGPRKGQRQPGRNYGRDEGFRSNSNSYDNYRENSEFQRRDVKPQDNKRNFGGSGGKNSPRHFEAESKASFEKRNNPQKNRTDEVESLADRDKAPVDKKYKFPSDKKLSNKKQIEKVLAGKVDETQRGSILFCKFK